MDNRRKSLPPLDTLVFFEAALRAGSFSAAASELYVSQAAVSKRVKQLETWLGTELFDRRARSLTPTQAGAQLADPVAMALDYLQTALNQVQCPAAPTIRIAANSAVSVFWLFKRLKSFALSPAAFPIETVVTDDPRDLLSEANDLAIIYAHEVPKGWSGHILMEEELAPVSSPEGALRFADDACAMPLLDYHRHAPDWINWEVWKKQHPDSLLHGQEHLMCESYSHSIGQALDGAGIALASRSLLEEELATGQLEVVAENPIRTGKGYFLVWQHMNKSQAQIEDLKTHFINS